MAARAGRRIRVAGLVVATCALAWAGPRPIAAAAGWQLTANPTTIAGGQAATIELRVTDTEGSGDIACARIVIGAEFEVLDLGIRGTSAPSAWVVEKGETAPTTVSVRNPDGNGKLKAGDWVDIYVTVSGGTVGSHPWTANALQNNDCSGDPFLEPITTVITVSSAAPASPAGPAPSPVGAEPIAPPAAAPVAEGSPALTFGFTSRAGGLDATGAEPTPGATSEALSEIAEPAGASAGAAGAVDDGRAREAGPGDASSGTGIWPLIAVVAILGGVGIHWVLTARRGRSQ